ncbi:uncharacterized protein BP5553_00238 [Venustampulla echinocandica]|uniref:Xylanolytic transcriptional activator regulatory domain-containing protein n=1 Tax=Venustampulla echinocandica TaxID=2656787 RepID=A0A370TXM1_9HELO|nr:uncharacterized protein BP5553_00238 [Venustampulla echinocandica]RDL40259.1 hypothetical protein BP5553_00238 [Venustampulla echinocandica]
MNAPVSKDSGGDNFTECFPKSKEDNDSPQLDQTLDSPQLQDSQFEESFSQSPLPSTDLDFESLFERFDAQEKDHSIFHWPWVEFPNQSGQYHGGLIQSPSPNNTPDALKPRSTEIRTEIYNAIGSLNIPEDEPRLKPTFEALDILTPERIHTFIKLYFHHWHRHGPIIHEPTFEPSKTALPLLLSVFAIGGMYSKDPLEVSMMKLLLDFIEIAVYSSVRIEDDYEIKQSAPTGKNDECEEQRQLEEFQGAYLMVVVQYWAGNAMAKKRVRQQRFMRLVSIARSRLALTTQHQVNFTLSNNQDFRSWIRRECILRTMNIMMTLDNAFGIFNNLPPHFNWSELDLELPCESKYFEATSYDDMHDRSCFPQRKAKVTEAFQLFFLQASPQSDRFDPVEKGALNMWDLQILVHVFYTFVWQQLFGNPVASVLPDTLNPFIASVKLALHNWKRVWDEVQCGIAPAELLAMGFPGSAERYWLVTRFVIHSFENNRGKPLVPIKADVDDTGAHLKPAMSLIHN